MLFYSLQHFGDFAWVPWLVQMLQHEENQLLVTYDGPEKAASTLAAEIEATSPRFRSVHVEKSLPVRWGGASMSEMHVAAMRKALEVSSWEFFINISGTCIPLVSQRTIREKLKDSKSLGHLAFIETWPSLRPVTRPQSDKTAGEITREIGRLLLHGNAGLLEQFENPDFFPVRNPANRPFLLCHEPPEKPNMLRIEAPDDSEFAFRQRYFQHQPHVIGRAWWIFHRSVVHDLLVFLDSAQSEDSRQVFLNSFQPDESFIPTILRNGLTAYSGSIVNHNFRAESGAPLLLNDQSFPPSLFESGAFFARKVEHESAGVLRREVERRVRM